MVRRALQVVLSCVGFGVGLIELAFSVHTVQAPEWIFWLLTLVGAGALVVGGLLLARAHPSKGRKQRAAVGLRLAAAVVDAFIDERGRERPRAIPFIDNTERLDRWNVETAARYRDTIRPRIRPIVAEAVACGAISRAVRPLFEAPHGTQLAVLRDLLRDAAEGLEHRVA